jgi:hypothetical protein
MKHIVTKEALKELATDIQYRELTLTEVSEHTDSWTLGTDWGMLDVDKGDVTFKPEVGMHVRFYGKGMGYTVRGVVIPQPEQNIIFHYRTEKEAEADHQQWIKEENDKKIELYKKNEKTYEAVYASLPECFQKRIDRFRANNLDFNHEYLEYELFCCTESLKIAKKLKTVEQIDNWRQMAWDAQRKIVDISPDHSGNTFGASVLLAKYYLTDVDNVVKQHGALCPLVGCKDYGCVGKTEEGVK